MSTVQARAYLSPTLVLLAMDWPDGEKRNDFLGFAVKRMPGFQDLKTKIHESFSWLPNRLSFNGPPAKGMPDFPSNEAPIQKFLWWDARLEGLSANQQINYEISAVTGSADKPIVDSSTTMTLPVTLPDHVELVGIGTWFNRAVMSSQAFSRMVEAMDLHGELSPEQALILRKWLANGMEKPVPDFISRASSLAGAIYHLTDNVWIIPALQQAMSATPIGLVYDSHIKSDEGTGQPNSNPNEGAIKILDKVSFFGRNKTTIMHNKYLVAGDGLMASRNQQALSLTCGSANYTTEGLTSPGQSHPHR